MERIGMTLVLIAAAISAAVCVMIVFLATNAPQSLWIALPACGMLVFLGVALGISALRSTRHE